MIPKISNPDTTGTPKPTVYQASHPFPWFLHLHVRYHRSGVECHFSSWPSAPWGHIWALKCPPYHTPVPCTQQALNRCMIWSEFSSLLPAVLQACPGLMLIKLRDFVLELLPNPNLSVTEFLNQWQRHMAGVFSKLNQPKTRWQGKEGKHSTCRWTASAPGRAVFSNRQVIQNKHLLELTSKRKNIHNCNTKVEKHVNGKTKETTGKPCIHSVNIYWAHTMCHVLKRQTPASLKLTS